MTPSTHRDDLATLRHDLARATHEVRVLIADAETHLAAGRCEAAAARISAGLLTLEMVRSRLLRRGRRRRPRTVATRPGDQ